MKHLPIALSFLITTPTVFSQDQKPAAVGSAAEYEIHKLDDNIGALGNSIANGAHAVGVPIKETSNAVWGYLSDVGNGMEKRQAVSAGDGVSINTTVYSLALRKAERENDELKTLQKDRSERQFRLKRAKKETERLEKISSEYKQDAIKFQNNIENAVDALVKTAKKLDGWDKEHQEKLDKLLAEHKKLGSLTAEDGKSRSGGHTLVSLKESWSDLESFIKRSPASANKIGLNSRIKAMNSLLSGATERIENKENQIMEVTAKLNELSKVDEKQVADDEASMKRQMILGTLNNSVNNLISQAEYSKVRSQLAFSHFSEIEKELEGKGVKAGDVKNEYKKHAVEISNQYNNTPLGVYVNTQIAKAMGTVCDLVNNQCKEGINTSVFDFLDDSSRFNFKSIEGISQQNKKEETADSIEK